jgi:hypothetical protein
MFANPIVSTEPRCSNGLTYEEEHNQPNGQEDKEEDLRKSHGCARNTGEAEQAGDDCNYQQDK